MGASSTAEQETEEKEQTEAHPITGLRSPTNPDA